MVLFLCETKAQIVNAITLKMSLFRDEEADICLCRKIAMPKVFETRLREIGIFVNVFSFEMEYLPKQDFFTMVKKSFKNVTMVKDIAMLLQGKLRENYSMVFVAGPGTACPAVYYGIKKVNPSVKLSLYEEGVFDYTVFDYPWNRIRRWYSKLFYNGFYLDDAKSLFVYEPSLVVDIPKRVEVRAIPKLFGNEEFRKHVNYVFGYDDIRLENIVDCQCLFLESCYNEERMEKQQAKILELFYKKLGDKIVVKMHPRSNIHKYDSIGIKQVESTQSMEMIMFNSSFNIENIIVVSVLSSALFNIKLMFGKEPKMVLLNNLLKISSNDAGIQKFSSIFSDHYNSDKLYQPTSLKDLDIIIDKLAIKL